MKEFIKSKQIASIICNRTVQIMKISTLLFFLSVFVVNAENLYPQQKELSLNLKNVTLQKAIAEIEKSSDYVFLITDEAGRELNKRTTLRVTNESIHSILEKMLKGTSLGYSVVERQVSLYRYRVKSVGKTCNGYGGDCTTEKNDYWNGCRCRWCSHYRGKYC